ncbi:MAG: acetate kinase [Coriobacteriales bacterium]|nr:acetate kinase [Coriobacteriales bacterium]
MNILVINAGSSSLKYQLVDMQTEAAVAKGLCERVGSEGSFHKYEINGQERLVEVPLPDHRAAVKAALDALLDPQDGAIESLDEIDAVGHRTVHGGEYFSRSVLIDDDVVAKVEECAVLAPLHNPPSLAGIGACRELMGKVPHVAVFDTAFHQTMPASSYRYALPNSLYEQHKIRRYGFHGTSHRYVTERAAAYLGKPVSELKLITCHLGNGCSIAAVSGGKVVDTSMGFTPLEGLMMGTRCGSIDPAIVTFMVGELGMSADDVNRVMNKESGLLGISGASNDLRDIEQAAEQGDARAQLANEMYAHAIRKHIGAYEYVLGGVDAIVFTAGVGENSSSMRSLIFQGLEGVGLVLDAEKNAERGGERTISTPSSRAHILVIPTNEELMIAKDAKACVTAG